jgi:cytochrome c-type biogenesis protein
VTVPDRREDSAPNPLGHRNRITGMVIVLVLALAIPLGVTLWNEAHMEGRAPDFTLTDTGYQNGTLRDPQTFSLSDYRGQVVVLDFMAVNCPGCNVMSERALAPLQEEFGHRDDFAILSINVWAGLAGETREDLIQFQEAHNGTWRHALDPQGNLRQQQYGVFGLPMAFVIDKDGFITHSVGLVLSPDRLRGPIEAALADESEPISFLAVGVFGLAILAGVASFFAPCSVGLIPAYMGFLLTRQQGLAPAAATRAAIRGGLTTAAGIVTLYAGFAILLLILALFGMDALIRDNLATMAITVGAALILVGLLLLAGFDWDRLGRRMGMGKLDGRRGFFPFGVGYGLAAFGCTGPIFLPILFGGFAQGIGVGITAFVLYTAAVASFVVLAAVLVAQGQTTRLRGLLSHTKTVTRVSAVLLVLAGVFVIWFEVQAGGWPF